MWSQALSVTWSCSAIAGPLLGGVFSTSGRKSFLFFNKENKWTPDIAYKNNILILSAGDGDVSPYLSSFFRHVIIILSLHQSTHLFRRLGCNCYIASGRSTETGLRCIMDHHGSEIWLPWIVSFEDAVKLFSADHFEYIELYLWEAQVALSSASVLRQNLDVSSLFFPLNQFHLSFVKGLHHQSCRCLLLVSYFFYMLATMRNTLRGNAFSRPRLSIIFLQVTCFFLFSRGPLKQF